MSLVAEHAGVPSDAGMLAAIRQRQQATWASGDYAVIGTTLQIVGERLAEAADSAVDEAVAEGGVATAHLLPVLADRTEAVRAARDEAFPQVRTARTSVSNGEGWQAGRDAAERASRTGQGQVPSNRRRGLGR